MSSFPLSIPPDAGPPDADTPNGGSTKRVLEDLLRARRLHKDAPPLRGEDRRLRPLGTGVPVIDELLAGGFPRGQLSELHGPASSGRTGLLLALVARVTRGSGLVALVDPLDRLDPVSAAATGVDLTRLLWLRGPRSDGEEPSPKGLADASAAVATLAGSGLFELVVLDLAGVGRALRSLPATTWLRLHRLVEETPTALVIVGDGPVACSPGGASLALEPLGPRWSGSTGPARLFRTLATRARAGRHGLRTAEIVLSAVA
jgi:hypothetical protein